MKQSRFDYIVTRFQKNIVIVALIHTKTVCHFNQGLSMLIVWGIKGAQEEGTNLPGSQYQQAGVGITVPC